MVSELICPNCNETQEANAKYCDSCGAPLEGEAPSEPLRKMTKSEVEAILQMRQEKDQAFKNHPQSPIPENMRLTFKGLNFFPVNPSYRFLCKLNRYPNPATSRMTTSTGQEREYIKAGYLRFTIEGKTQTLQAYKDVLTPQHEGQKESLFIPFRDATSGGESYNAARYLDVEQRPDGLFLLDFNRAYNPYCAYSEDYSCPLSPRDNWLEVLIKAGEKKFKD
jgi:uncharacterized protein (DUF1684 family)